MQQETLRAESRFASGTRPSRRLRRDGRVPAIVYGRGLDTVSVSVNSRDLYGVLRTEAGLNALINVEVEGAETVLTVAREIQRDPVRGRITHLDFIKVSLDEAIEAEVTLEFTGTPLAVTEDGAFVETIETSVLISALPTQIPPVIEVDIEHLGVGDTLKVGDLPVLDGVTVLDEAERPLATVVLPSIVEEPVEEEALLEGEEGIEGEEGADEEGGAEAAEGDEGEG